MTPSAPATRPPLLSVVHLQLVVLLLLALRLGFMLFVAPIGDEAYYWIWGQHPDLSYFDHPPLNAWLLGLMSQVFGWTIGGLRLLGWLTTAGTIWIFWLWSRRFDPRDREGWFWLATAAYLATPIVAIFSGIMFPDHLLVFLSLAALYAFARFFETWDAGHEQWHYLFLGAIALGLAALAKYSAIFVAVAVMLHVLLAPRRWGLLARWQVYATALLVVAILSPVLIWNVEHGFASFSYHLVERNAGIFEAFDLWRVTVFSLLNLLYLSPFLLLPLLGLLLARRAGNGRDLARLTFAGSTAFFGLLAASLGALPYWNILAHVALFPHIATWLGARFQLIAHLVYGVLAFGLVLVNYALLPVSLLTGGSDWESSVVYGWDEIAAAVAAAEASERPDFLAATRYTLAAQLSFARGRDDVTTLSSRIDQYDYWFDPAAHAGQTALILGDTSYGVDAETAASFARVTEIGRFDVERFGRVVNTYVLYRAEGYGEGASGLPSPIR